jgi:hypothetical protein
MQHIESVTYINQNHCLIEDIGFFRPAKFITVLNTYKIFNNIRGNIRGNFALRICGFAALRLCGFVFILG